MTDWTIGVKRLGGEGDFSINVSPDEDLNSLHNKIKEHTGLQMDQQRLIYRGRIIGGADSKQRAETEVAEKRNPRVRDIMGLSDGHTIHLVPKRAEAEPSSDTTPDSSTNNAAASGAEDDSSSGPASGFLAALLGLSGAAAAAGASDNGLLRFDPNSPSVANPEPSLSRQIQRLRSARLARRRSLNTYRLSHADLEVQDPGSMEPVRQGMMTMHSVLTSESTEGRQFYRGQWIDCRDTVNQWLEATVVEVIDPDDILPRQLSELPRRSGRPTPTHDSAVSADDFEGRMRLLLEQCDEYPAEGEWGGYRPRESNEGVKLLLIHYNGWPHRWDEWIRSDSERLRPFRTRTRHSPSSPRALPIPDSAFVNAPGSHIHSESDQRERAALLPELHRLLRVVNDEVENATALTPLRYLNAASSLPWLDHPAAEEDEEVDPLEMAYNRSELERIAPMLDRLGRLLQEAAPHVASFAASLPKEGSRRAHEESNVVMAGEEDVSSVEAAAENTGSVAAVATSIGAGSFNPEQSNVVLVDETRREVNNGGAEDDDADDAQELLTMLLPDYADFNNGFVNTTRGEARSRNRGREGPSDGTGLLGTYLAASGLGGDENNSGLHALARALRDRDGEGAGGGIDIHIHAIVTPNTGAMTMIGDPQISNRARQNTTDAPAPTSLPVLEEAPPEVENETDDGIFSDLYSETPSPVNPHADSQTFPSSVRSANVVPESPSPRREDAPLAPPSESLLVQEAEPVPVPRLPTRSLSDNLSRISPGRGDQRPEPRTSPRRRLNFGGLFRRGSRRRPSS